MNIVWFKKDLRTTDHAPLAEAVKLGDVVCLYVFEPEQLEADDFAPIHLMFLRECLESLDVNLRRLGNKLHVLFGDLPRVFQNWNERFGIQSLHAHEETGNWLSYQRDRRVRRWCKETGIAFQEKANNGVVRRLASRDDWASRWNKHVNQPILAEPENIPSANLDLDSNSGWRELDQWLSSNPRWAVKGAWPGKATQSGGTANGWASLDSFLHHRGRNYRSDMSSPLLAEHGCSRLSPYLTFGCLSTREVYQQAESRAKNLRSDPALDAKDRADWGRSLSSFKSRLAWHCHFIQKLEDEPQIEFQNINRAYDGLRESEFNESYFEAWCKGETGYPMIDACMRSLHETGWINFRMRAMLASFAAYHLWLHWERPAKFLATQFLDYEPGIHYPQFQMQSGVTGINTIRIYSPQKQLIDQDPDGAFVKRFIPELNEVPLKHLAQPHLMTSMEQMLFSCRLGVDYPAPIVDHKIAYHSAKERIHNHKNAPHVRQESAQVYQKHGSRSSPRERR
ncbi:MAG: DNA photolyase family protein [Pirellula sp.]|nr:DNA photolyase family protein [Pirellula sp.]